MDTPGDKLGGGDSRSMDASDSRYDSNTNYDPSTQLSPVAEEAATPFSMPSDRPTSDDLKNELQTMVQEINDKRAKDLEMLNEFQNSLLFEVSQVCDLVRSSIMSHHEDCNKCLSMHFGEMTKVLQQAQKQEVALATSWQALASIMQLQERP
ncbi:unnamed protein product [Lampetra planeri]